MTGAALSHRAGAEHTGQLQPGEQQGKLQAGRVLLMPTVPSSGPGTACEPSPVPRPRAGAARRASAAQLKGRDNPEGKAALALLPDATEPRAHGSRSLPPCSPSLSQLPRSSPRRSENPHRPTLHFSVLICILLSSNPRLAGAGKPQAGQGLFGLQSTQHSSGFHSPSILLKLFYFPHRIMLFGQRLHCPLRQ